MPPVHGRASIGADMSRIRRAFVASLVATAALAVGVPTAGASAAEDFVGALGPCSTYAGPEGQGGTAGTVTQICMGAGGVADVGASIGQIATVVGPRIDGSPVIGTSIVSAGDVASGPPV